MTCFNQGDSEPPGHPGNEHPVAEDKPVDKQLDKNIIVWENSYQLDLLVSSDQDNVCLFVVTEAIMF